jgi:hypothetical protein
MTLRIFSFVDGQGASESSAASRRIFTPFNPRDLSAFSDRTSNFETIADRPLYRDLQGLYFVWRHLAQKFDYVGFESAARPLLIDPLSLERHAREFPAIARLRAHHFVNWLVPVLPVTEPARRYYAAMRNALSEAECDRIERWVAGFDVITTPLCLGLGDTLCGEFFKDRWPLFVDIVRNIGVFSQLPVESIMTSALWPRHNSFIMKSELFAQFIGPAFEAIFEFERWHKNLLTYGADLFMERLLGLYLEFLNFSNPLNRLAELPILLPVPQEPPRALPAGFDADRYLEFNPDVAAAGLPA